MFSKQNSKKSHVARFFSVLFATLIMSLSFASCSDNKDEPDMGIADYYSTCESVTGDRISSQEADELKTAISSVLEGTWQNISREQATYYFDRECNEMMDVLEYVYKEANLRGTVNVTLALRNVNNGRTVKRKHIKITSSGATMD